MLEDYSTLPSRGRSRLFLRLIGLPLGPLPDDWLGLLRSKPRTVVLLRILLTAPAILVVVPWFVPRAPPRLLLSPGSGLGRGMATKFFARLGRLEHLQQRVKLVENYPGHLGAHAPQLVNLLLDRLHGEEGALEVLGRHVVVAV